MGHKGMHLRQDELLDLAEGVRAESSAPHLAGCDACRRQLADLRGTMAAVRGGDVPEPSPLFWDHFSARVREAVSVERAPAASGFWSWPRVLMPIAAVAAVVVVAIALGRSGQRPATIVVSDANVPAIVSEPLADVDEPSLRLVADLSKDLDWDGARDAGLAASGSADHAVTHLTEGELRELRRLLKELI